MPQRKSTRRYPSPEIQGEDSWVEVSRLTVGEAREINQRRGDLSDAEAMEAVIPIYQHHIVGWNWVDDDGQPLPLPGDEPGVVDQLTDLEFEFIANCLAGERAEQKNSSGASSKR